MMAAIISACAGLLAASIGFLYGVMYLGFALSYCLMRREFWFGQNKEDRAHLERASRDLWSLSDGAGALLHNFLKLADGTQLHYLSPRQSPQKTEILVIFVHGFPDSGHLFTRQLNSELAKIAKLVALDLPGCGGSDSLARYGPNEMMNPVVLAIIELKRRYLGSNATGRCILVGHDWGGVVGFRIAAETCGLVSEVVTLNSLYPAYAEEQLRSHISRASSSLSAWRFCDAGRELLPVLSQLKKSSYTYMLTLPFPLAKAMPRVAFSLLRYAHKMEYGWRKNLSSDIVATQLAKSCGPGAVESTCPASGSHGYSSSVLARSKTWPPGDLDQRVQLYTDGLLRERWTQPWPNNHKPDRAEHVPATFDLPAPFKCPVTIIFGLQDVALDSRIVLDGIEKYFVREDSTGLSATRLKDRIVRLPRCGHWSILEEDGENALSDVLEALIGEG